MADEIKKHDAVEDVEISSEMRESFLDYSMSVIVQRALPDVRDGLKPVHRRILYAMNSLNMTAGAPHKKSARIVGDVIGKYHPHGDVAVYDAMVRMAQDFSYRYPLIDGHGNFGSLDGDGAAAMRYTEARMSKISTEMVTDINKETVDFTETYDAEGQEPSVLPSRIPNLLLNGAMGIAVGMATNIPPHNLSEVVAAINAVMDDPDISVSRLMEVLPGPDFPTGGTITGRKGIKQAYETGRGSIKVRAKYRIEDMNGGKKRVIFYEIPYAVNKANMMEKMANLIRDKQIQGVTYLNDESNRNGVRIVMELRKDVQENVVINNLFKMTPLESSFGINMLALENGRPKQLTLKQIINDYIDHQVEVIRRKTEFELKKAQERAHILEGLRIALANLDAVIAMIRASRKDENGLIMDMCSTFGLDDVQARAILAMQLRRLSGLERDKIENEYQALLETIKDLEDILANHSRIIQIIRDDLAAIEQKYGDSRRTEIIDETGEVLDEELIPVENSIIMLTDSGYIKRQPVDTFHSQNRGGKGIRSLTLNEEDSLGTMINMSSHDNVLLFTNLGRVYRMKGYHIPTGSRISKGTPIVNILGIPENEKVQTLLPYSNEQKAEYLLFVTKNGVVKRTAVSEFDNITKNGKIAISLRDGDELVSVKATSGDDEIIIAGSNGKAVRFKEDQIREMGRNAAGVMGFNTDGSEVVGVALKSEGDTLLSISENGYGKRSHFEDYRLTSRGKKGVSTMNITEKTGKLVSVLTVSGDEDAMIVASDGIMIRIHVSDVGIYSRNVQGLKLINLNQDETVNKVTLVEKSEEPLEEIEVVDDEGQPVQAILISSGNESSLDRTFENQVNQKVQEPEISENKSE